MLSKQTETVLDDPREPDSSQAPSSLNQPSGNPNPSGVSDTQEEDLTAPSGIEDGADARGPGPAPGGAADDRPPSTTEPPTPPKSDAFRYDDLDPAIASAAQEAATRIRSLLRTEVLTPIEIGRALLSIKARLLHGQFSPWLEAEFGWSERTAQRYMRLSQAFGAKPDTVSGLPIAILHRLAATSTKPEVREAILSRRETGERLRSEDILKLLRPEPSQVKQRGEGSTPGTAGPKACRPQPGAFTATMASAAQESLPAAQAARAAARIIIARLGSDFDRLAEMLERADPHDLVRMILSGLHKQHDAGRAFDRSNPECEHDAQSEILPTGKGESVDPSEAASAAPAPKDVGGAQSAASEPDSASPTPLVADTLSGVGRAGTKAAHDDIPGFLLRTTSTPLCMQPTGGSPAGSAADALAGEGMPTSTPWLSPATQRPIERRGDNRTPDDPTPVRAPSRGRRDKLP